MKTNKITVNISGEQNCFLAPDIRWEYDLVQYLKLEGIDLPDNYQVDFCNTGDSETITMIGNADGILIPDQLIQSGLPIEAYLVLQTGEESWNTQLRITIPVASRPERTDIEPTPEEQTTIDSLVAAMNRVVADGVGIPAGGSSGQVLSKKSDADYDVEWKNGGGGGGLFVVKITGSGYYRTSDKTPTEIKAAFDAGMSVIADIVNDSETAYLFKLSSTRAEFHSLPLQGLNNEHSSIMFYSYTINGASSTSVSRSSVSVTSAEELYSSIPPHFEYLIDWNSEGKYYPSLMYYDLDYYGFFRGELGTIDATLRSAYDDNGVQKFDVYKARKVWLALEYDPYWGEITDVGHVIFTKTDIDGSALRTTELEITHVMDNNILTIVSRTIAEGTVTATTDVPEQFSPE